MRRTVAGLVLLGLTACSSSGVGDPSASGPSANQANAFAEQFAGAFSHSMAGSGVSASLRPLAAAAAGSGAASVPINQQVTGVTNCTAGGRIEVSGNLTGNIDETGSGVLFLQVLETITDWRCIPPYVINGDPYLSAAGSMSFQNGQLASPASISFGGGFKWGTTAAESFQIHLTLLLNPDGSGRISGVMGPHSVDVTF